MSIFYRGNILASGAARFSRNFIATEPAVIASVIHKKCTKNQLSDFKYTSNFNSRAFCVNIQPPRANETASKRSFIFAKNDRASRKYSTNGLSSEKSRIVENGNNSVKSKEMEKEALTKDLACEKHKNSHDGCRCKAPQTSIVNSSNETSTSSSGDNGMESISENKSQSIKSAVNDRFLIGFTCKVCKCRQYKTVSKRAYNHGVVLIKCDGCQNRHLFADNLGWFRDSKLTIEDLMKEQGEVVKKSADEGLFDYFGVDSNDELYEALKDTLKKKSSE
ncbi:DNL-type zinc finger protein [Smittium culicis]|uniref:DNL-type zinc finger protein n=1 Tax=Smittium culicis TaxID=133412 RepID=A0A1R1XGG0_9FUNG|nr:DNL-type zinc finger protein [Smittium culicis]